MKKAFTLLLVFNPLVLFCQINIAAAANHIDSMVVEDQKWRNLLTQVDNNGIDTITRQEVVKQINQVDSLNYLKLKNIFNEFGFLGNDKVGEKTSHNYWLLIQHMDKYPTFQDSILSEMKVEAKKGNASLIDYAYLIDRVKVNNNLLQIYGTQMRINADSSSYEPKPLIEPHSLDERRKEVGLPPMKYYIQTMNKRYYGNLKSQDKH